MKCEDEPDAEINVNMDDILEEPPASVKLQEAAGNDWIEHKGQKFHKASLLRIMFCSNFMRKSKERLQQVRAYTADFANTSDEASEEALLGVSLFVLGDPFTILIRTGQHVALAILQVTGIDHKSHKVASVSSAELELESVNFKISGQVLHLITSSTSSTVATAIFNSLPDCLTIDSSPPNLLVVMPTVLINRNAANLPLLMVENDLVGAELHDASALILSTNGSSSITIPAASPTLLWTGVYIKFNAIKAKKDKGKKTATSASENVSQNALVLMSPSYMVEPISGILVGAQELLPADARDLRLHGLTETWRFDVRY